MTDDGVAAARRYVEAFNRRDVEAMIAATEPGFEFHTPRGTTIRGHDALRSAMAESSNLAATIVPQRWFANGSSVVMFGLVRYAWTETSEPAGEEEQAAICTVGDRGLQSVRPYLDRDAALGSLAIGMSILAIILLARDATGSFAQAGRVVAAFGVCNALGAVAQGRLMDRLGQPRVLRVAAVAHLAALAALVVAAGEDSPDWVLAGFAALAGMTLPQVPAAMRSLWNALVEDAERRQTPHALVAIVFEVAVTTAPVLVARWSRSRPRGPPCSGRLPARWRVRSCSPPRAPRTGGAAKHTRSAGLARSSHPACGPCSSRWRPLAQVAVPACAADHGSAELGGLLLGGLSAGSLAGGLATAGAVWSVARRF
jgi:SnoaL-like domain/Major Facilitator Superfamily